MSQNVMNRFVAALRHGDGLRDDFIYYMSFDDYQNFPDPFPRRTFTVAEVQESIHRYPNPADLTQVDPAKARVGVAQHIASLGIPVLAISLPGHYSRSVWPPIPERVPEFVIGTTPAPEELRNRLAVYTFRMCAEAIKTLVEKHLPHQAIFM